MTNILLALILLAMIAGGIAGISVYRRVRAVYAELRAFVTPMGENQPSPAAQTVEAASDILARALVARAKTTFMGIQSGAARAERGIEGDIAEGAIGAASPMLGAVLAAFPALRKTLRRNPGLVDLALAKLGGMGKGSAPGALAGSGNGSQSRFKL